MLALALLGCGDPTSDTPDTTDTVVTAVPGVAPPGLSAEEVLAGNVDASRVSDDEWTLEGAVAIELDGTSGAVDGDGATVTDGLLTITAGGTYVLTGSFEGQVRVAAPEDALVTLVLAGVTVQGGSAPAIRVDTADDVLLQLQAGTASLLADSATSWDPGAPNATVYAACDLTVAGEGALEVVASGGDAITSEDDLVVRGGVLTVTAADDCLRGKDALVVAGGDLDLSCDGDGLHADDEDDGRGWVLVEGGTLTIDAGDDGIDAASDVLLTGGTTVLAAADDGVHAEEALVIEGGELSVTASTEGLEGFYVAVTAGMVDVRASDDGVNGAGGATRDPMGDGGQEVWITGGRLVIDADGDGLDSNGSLVVAGGDTVVWGPIQSMNGALDANAGIAVDGGTLLAVGSAGMPEAP
ncbi:MAG: carbohydrate-binding domain-containing protein, partial [Myxococcales bacterium]|nr:carbohydrate-binding domain-containing protein [Myxococcales bacterium]